MDCKDGTHEKIFIDFVSEVSGRTVNGILRKASGWSWNERV